ncbi:MAG: PKD domain-containing protein, partial [Candidatus Lokiarchaeota archaeon]|nr:PKD domain-containing protein [Candidatus Lokiarchaeota archaeon]
SNDISISKNKIPGCEVVGISMVGMAITITNNTIDSGNVAGIYLSGSSFVVSSNIIMDARCGIQLVSVTNATLESNSIQDCAGDGINVTNGVSIVIRKNVVMGCDDNGIVFWGMNGTIIYNHVDSVGGNGIFTYGSDRCLIRLNDLHDTGKDGISVKYTYHAQVIGNVVWNTGYYGIEFWDDCRYTDVTGNIIKNTSWAGYHVDGSSAVYPYWNSIDGIVLGDMDFGPEMSEIAWNDLKFKMPHWIFGEPNGTDICFVRDFNLEGNLRISAQQSGSSPPPLWSKLTLTNLTITGELLGFMLQDVTIEAITAGKLIIYDFGTPSKDVWVINCGLGEVSLDGRGVRFEHNNVGGECMFHPYSSVPFVVRNNTFGIPIRINGTREDLAMLDLDTWNFLAGKPVLYYFGQENTTITSLPEFGQLILAGCDNVTVLGRFVTRASVHLIRSIDLVISTFNIVDGLRDAISLFYCEDVVVRNNVIINASRDGIMLWNTNSSLIENNTLARCKGFGMSFLQSSMNNLAVWNNFTANTGGPAWSSLDSNWLDDSRNGNYYDDYRLKYPSALNNGTHWLTPYVINGSIIDMIDHLPLCGDLKPEASFTVNATNIILGSTLNFTWTGFGGNYNPTFLWDFKDGSYSTSAAPLHLYNTAGTFNVSLTVMDHDGDIEYAWYIILVQAPRVPVAAFTQNATVIVQGQQVGFSFTGDEGNTPASFTWDFGDGNSSSSREPTHTFVVAGNYTVTLTITDFDGDVDVGWVLIMVQADVVQTVSFNASQVIVIGGQPVTFTPSVAGGNGPLTWSWDFGDGNASIVEGVVMHVFTTHAGSPFNVSLTVIDSDGDKIVYWLEITVLEDFFPSVSFSVNATSCIVNETIVFTPSVAGGNGPLTWSWDFGDGNASIVEGVVMHVFTTHVGSPFNVSLTVTDDDGDVVIYWLMLDVEEDTSPVIHFLVNATNVTAGQQVLFTPVITGGNEPFTWFWDFGDGSTSFESGIITHAFLTHVDAPFNVSLVIRDKNGDLGRYSIYVLVVENGDPIIIPPGDIFLTSGDMGNVISWLIMDATIGSTWFQITRNNTLISSGSWSNGVPVVINVDILLPGKYVYTIIAGDGCGASVTDSVIVHVSGQAGPTRPTSFEITTGIMIAATCVVGGLGVLFFLDKRGIINLSRLRTRFKKYRT